MVHSKSLGKEKSSYLPGRIQGQLKPKTMKLKGKRGSAIDRKSLEGVAARFT